MSLRAAQHVALVVQLSAGAFWFGVIVAANTGCGPHTKPPSSFSHTPQSGSFTGSASRYHFADGITPQERLDAEDAIRAHEVVAYSDLHFAVVFHLGQSWPTRVVDVYVHPGETLGSPFMPPVEGRRDPDGSVHVVIGRGAVVPDLVHQLAHSWWAPMEEHSRAPHFWADVLLRQSDSVNKLKILRGVP